MESPHLTFNESTFVLNPSTSLTGDEFFSELELYVINTRAQHASTHIRVKPDLNHEEDLCNSSPYYHIYTFRHASEIHIESLVFIESLPVHTEHTPSEEFHDASEHTHSEEFNTSKTQQRTLPSDVV